MPAGAAEKASTSVARFNQPGRKLPKKVGPPGDGAASVKPRIYKQGFTRFLTLADLDARTKAAARARQIMAAISNDLGGEDGLTEAQRQLVMRAAMLSVQAEDYETRFLLGQPVELPDYLATTNNLRRMLQVLGLERRARDVTPVESYAALSARIAAEQGARRAAELAEDDALQTADAAGEAAAGAAVPSGEDL